MQPFHCGQCGQTVFFENHGCGACGAALGYAPLERRMVALASAPDPSALGQPIGEMTRVGAWTCCANRHAASACNWLLPADPQADGQTDEGRTAGGAPAHATAPATAIRCLSCQLSAVIPDLSVAGNGERWFRIEQAKRRLVYTLIAIGLKPDPKTDKRDEMGLAFHLLADGKDRKRVMTGHGKGVITLNVAEADDHTREAIRVAMGEPVRTLLGHLRHEISHYLQYRWLTDGESAEVCRSMFGDERADYAKALASYHEHGAPPDWDQHYISAYASAHPWEDWAETCAHVLLILDAVETAACWGLTLDGPAASAAPAVQPLHPAGGPPIDELVLSHWLPVAGFVNAMNRSLGMPDSYPFLIPDPVLRKMQTVHVLLRKAASRVAQASLDPGLTHCP